MSDVFWSAQVGPDRVLKGIWYGFHGLAMLAIGLSLVDMPWPWSIPVGLAALVGLSVLARRQPDAWFASGSLSMKGDWAHWHPPMGDGVEGSLAWVWTGDHLIGIILLTPQGRIPLWLTARRVGPVAWWQLQRWMRLN